MARLVYETPDRAFAALAVDTLRRANIPSYQVSSDESTLYVPKGDAQVCIYITNDSDYAQANELLVKAGAATEPPLKFPPPWVLFVVTALIVALGCWVALEWT